MFTEAQWDQFDAECVKAGFLKLATWCPSGGGAQQDVYVKFEAPTTVGTVGDTLITELAMRYRATKFPGIKRGELVTIDSTKYRVRENPHSELDGSRRLALLEKVGTQ